MKVARIKAEPTPPPEDRVTIELSMVEAQLLRDLLAYDDTVPTAVYGGNRDTLLIPSDRAAWARMSNFMGALGTSLCYNGIKRPVKKP